ncbi:MAG: hypothetical protein IT379_38245 [Deltaproteobacteria bacterium]|nr:hypothetical protein [Deltaproteobacteria bacterium]
MKLGFVGPATDDDLLVDAVEFLVVDVEVDRVIYLGRDGRLDRIPFEGRLAHAMGRCTSLTPTSPGQARIVEMIDDRILTAVYDKARLDEDDIANSSIIVWGRNNEPLHKAIGPRHFVTPGTLRADEPVVLVIAEEPDDEGATATLFETSGRPLWSERLTLARRSTVRVR